MKKTDGFTLIELLVVIAIIAILALVVMISVSTVNHKGADGAARHGLSTTPEQAQLYYADHNRSYVVDSTHFICSSSESKSLYPIVLNAANNEGLANVVINDNPSGGNPLETAKCNNSLTDWAVEVPMKIKNVGGAGKSAMFCADSTGYVGYTSSSIGSGVSCPSI